MLLSFLTKRLYLGGRAGLLIDGTRCQQRQDRSTAIVARRESTLRTERATNFKANVPRAL